MEDECFGVFDFGLTEDQEERAARLHRESVIVDLLFQGPCGYRMFTDEMMKELHRCEEDAAALESGQASAGNMSSTDVLLANGIGADLGALAAVKRGHVAVQVEPSALANVQIPALVLVGKHDLAGHRAQPLADYIPTARFGSCEGDHSGALFEPSFQQAMLGFLTERWTCDGVPLAPGADGQS